jgi:hypothetical protein
MQRYGHSISKCKSMEQMNAGHKEPQSVPFQPLALIWMKCPTQWRWCGISQSSIGIWSIWTTKNDNEVVIKVSAKFSLGLIKQAPCHEGVRGSGGIAAPQDYMDVTGQLHAHQLNPLRETPLVPNVEESGWTKNHRTLLTEENLLPPPGIEPRFHGFSP